MPPRAISSTISYGPSWAPTRSPVVVRGSIARPPLVTALRATGTPRRHPDAPRPLGRLPTWPQYTAGGQPHLLLSPPGNEPTCRNGGAGIDDALSSNPPPARGDRERECPNHPPSRPA